MRRGLITSQPLHRKRLQEFEKFAGPQSKTAEQAQTKDQAQEKQGPEKGDDEGR